MTGNTIYLVLGGNEGDRLRWLEAGRKGIADLIGPIITASAIYETAAWGNEAQAAFLNQVVEVNTALSPGAALRQITEIERNTAGRIRTQKWAPRKLDIDILFYNSEVIHEEGLTIPHPHLADRRFVLVPLCEIAPLLMHPVLEVSCVELLARCEDTLHVSPFLATRS